MHTDAWKKYSNFSEVEPWGNPSLIDEQLVILLQSIRDHAQKPIIIHAGTQGTHAPRSLHYIGKAVDFHIQNMCVLDQYLIAEKIVGCGGIGIYPFWNNPGLHIDIRHTHLGARWIQSADGSYQALNAPNFYLIL